ncbi:MAG: hypothetical protein KAT15_13285, partial [Bacteroidales bacterium]|nr:hypothetical protein [Bacteroidales bacterium]
MSRTLVLFNDEYQDNSINVSWRILIGDEVKSSGSFQETVVPGDHVERIISFIAPYTPADTSFHLELSSSKGGQTKFTEWLAFKSRDVGLAPPMAVASASFQRQGETVQISWTPVTANTDGNPTTISEYVLYKASDVGFTLTPDTITGLTAPAYNDNLSGILGIPGENMFYRLKAVDQNGVQSEFSPVYGVIDYPFSATPETDFNGFALSLQVIGLSQAHGLINMIPGCTSVARWNTAAQGYQQYVPDVSSGNFTVQAGESFLVNVTEDTVFTLTGEISRPSYTLITTPSTSYNSVMLPLDKHEITSASELMAEIPNCDGLAYWRASTQSIVQYIPVQDLNNFNVYTGHSYYVHVTEETVWPEDGDPLPRPAEGVTTVSPFKVPHAVFGMIEESQVPDGATLTAFLKHQET